MPPASGVRWRTKPSSRIASTWRSNADCASRSMTGPTSVARSAGSPTEISSIAPWSSVTTRGAMSRCTHSTRSAEQRWPALSNADTSASATTCSGSAELSAIIALRPPVSAISGTSGNRDASVRAMIAATSVDPVNATPATRASATSAAPTDSPRPGSRAITSAGSPARSITSTASAAVSGVCSAGFAATVLPAASAAATWPVKIASGKFQGEMHANTPRPCSESAFDSPVGEGSASASAKCERAPAA